MVLTMVFVGVSLVILLISAINISHTFLMLVSERRREIAIYRSVGASARQIRFIISGEALMLGIAGGIAGNIVGWLASRLANVLARPVFDRIPGSPSDLFSFSTSVFGFCLVCAVAFALVGAYGPSRRAAMTDPAAVLSQD
jgi:ABC-type antimicrobial peptide transport system permease subunit